MGGGRRGLSPATHVARVDVVSARKKPKPRSNVARGMILAGTGRGRVMRDRRSRRAKEREQRWTREDWGDGHITTYYIEGFVYRAGRRVPRHLGLQLALTPEDALRQARAAWPRATGHRIYHAQLAYA